ncbi:MAG: hypothetical protein M1812_000687 [Candelaria pacifica]|nr:MAG: hypothetical protein M1812_000687 [Candelaria pacifica]
MVAEAFTLPEQTVSDVDIIDIRRDHAEHSILDEIYKGLSPSQGQEKRLPTLLLYDERGLKLFEDITYLEQYYLTNAEIEILKAHAHAIAQQVEPGSMVIELGSGNLRKVNILLQALEKSRKSVEYYALDLSLPELERTLSAIPKGTYKYVKCCGLHGTYDDGLYWLSRPRNHSKPKCILSLGSSIGNFDREAAASFLRSFARRLHGGDRIIIGLDACKDPERVFHAYNDRDGVTHKFIMNGLLHANRILGANMFALQDWRVIGEWNESAGRHQAFYSPLRDVNINGCVIEAGEKIRVEESHKYATADSKSLWDAAGLVETAAYGNKHADYYLHMLARPSSAYPLRPEEYAISPVPTLADWKALWVAWDTVTLRMIPNEELFSKPIKLRNACIFYLGHIPTFLDMQLSRTTQQPSTEPAYYTKIFERGIDPDVDNPEHCHAHSEIPDSWPNLEDILVFQDRVRERVQGLYHNSEAPIDSKLARALWLAFEHEIMHLETLLYMLLQSDKTIPPSGARPNFEHMAWEANLGATSNQWIAIPKRKVTIGMNDPENSSGPDRYFGWDNEKPPRVVDVHSFVAKARPISNEDYARYLNKTSNPNIPLSWSEDSLLGSNANVTSVHTNGHTNGAANGNDSHLNGYANGAAGRNESNTDAHKDGYTNGHKDGAVNGNGSSRNGESVSLSNEYLKGKFVKTVYGPVPLEFALDWPVMASYDELAACATWMNGRIPTMEEVRSIYAYVDQLKIDEAEQVLGRTISAVNGHLVNDGVEETPPSHPSRESASRVKGSLNPHHLFANLEGCNVGLQHWHPTPITQHGNKLCGQGDLGGVWEWTSSVLGKHDGFEPMDAYPAYTTDFFDGKHNIVLGGSWATHPRVAGRKTFVNWYQRNYPYAWAGARLVKDI